MIIFEFQPYFRALAAYHRRGPEGRRRIRDSYFQGVVEAEGSPRVRARLRAFWERARRDGDGAHA